MYQIEYLLNIIQQTLVQSLCGAGYPLCPTIRRRPAVTFNPPRLTPAFQRRVVY